ncbi:MAG: hypothetical protein ACRCT1_13310 [Microcoleaceae cyanobacterium]
MSTPSYSLSESLFLNQVRRTIRLKNMSRNTQKSYRYDRAPSSHPINVSRDLGIARSRSSLVQKKP